MKLSACEGCAVNIAARSGVSIAVILRTVDFPVKCHDTIIAVMTNSKKINIDWLTKYRDRLFKKNEQRIGGKNWRDTHSKL